MNKMLLLITLFAVGAAVEIFVHEAMALWRARRQLAAAAIIVTSFAGGGLFVWRPSVWTGLLLVTSLYRVFNDLRIVEARMHERYLHAATRRTTWRLLGLQTAVGGLWAAWQWRHPSGRLVWNAVAGVQLGMAAVLLASTSRRLTRTRWPQASKPVADRDLPSLTVAVPARNETDDLERCLETLIASDYPKLEVLVLDDCSQDKRTPEIIRSFAHAGVRFVQGEIPSDTWLPKNQAYDRLLHEASGDYVLFCGVDVRFGPDALRRIIEELLARQKDMMSFVPEREPAARPHLALAQAMRYWWELGPPRRWLQRPPVMSSCWIIRRDAIEHAGGFRAVSRSIVPEAYFAKRLLPHGYSFMRASAPLALTSSKTSAEQRATAIRVRYPQLHRRPEQVLVAALLEAGLLVLPFVMAIGGPWLPFGGVAQAAAFAACVLLEISYVAVARATRINAWWFAVVAVPIVALADLWFVHTSMWQYEFSVVSWKGRNVCIPAMHVVPHLPPLNKE